MPAKSKSQEHFFGMVRALQKGELDTKNVPPKVKQKIRKVADSMSATEVNKFAKTKTKNLPDHVDESVDDESPWNDINLKSMSFLNFLIAEQVINEEWSTEYEVPASKKGMFDGYSLAELKGELSKLTKTGPHKKGSPEYTKEKELEFAIRAKSGWTK